MRSGRVILAVSIAAAVIVGAIVAGLSLRRGSPSDDCGELQCGQWCVYRCAQLLGVPADMPEVVSRLPHRTGGHSMLELAQALQGLGLETEGRQGDWDALVEAPRPGIAHLKDPQHFVVVCSVDPNREFVHLFDGEGYRTRYSRRQFEKRWTGAYLALTRPTAADLVAEPARRPGKPAPQARFETLLLDVGDVSAVGKPVEFVFPLRNLGTADLVVQEVEVSCQCLKSEKPDKPIPPGGAGAVRIVYHVEPRKGPFSHSALVETNDPRSPKILLTATGFSGVEVQIHPAGLHLNDLVLGRECTARCFVRYTGDWEGLEVQVGEASLQGVELVAHSCRPIDEGLARQLASGSTREIRRPNDTRILDVVFRPTREEPGEIEGSIRVRTNIKGYEDFTLAVGGRIRRPIEAYPGMLVFGEVDPQAEYSQAVSLVAHAAEPFEVLGIDAPSLQVEGQYPRSSGNGMCEIRFRASGRALLEASGKDVTVRLRSSHSADEVRVPLAVRAWPVPVRR